MVSSVLNAMISGLYRTNPAAASVRASTANTHARFLVELAEKYNDAEESPQLEKAMQKVEDVKVKIHEEIKCTIGSPEKVIKVFYY